MADFDPAFEFLISHEGGYVADPDDPGGATKFGLSQRSYPDLDIIELSLAQARDIYRTDWWAAAPYASLLSQPVANKVFDLAVNMGMYEAHRILQQACGDCGQPTACDGHLGPVTLTMANRCDPTLLVAAMRQRASDFYYHLAAVKPSNERFLKGWLARAQA